MVFHKLLSYFSVHWLVSPAPPPSLEELERSPFPLLARMLFSRRTYCQIANIWAEGSAKVLRGSALGSSLHTFLSAFRK